MSDTPTPGTTAPQKKWEPIMFLLGGGCIAWFLGLWIGHLVSCFETAFWWARKS